LEVQEMTESIQCPVCNWKWDGQKERCPECDFSISRFRSLLSGKPVLYDEGLKAEYEEELEKSRKNWMTKELLRGDAVLGIVTSEDAEIWIDGHKVGTTQGKYIQVRNLSAGRHVIEAKSRYASSHAEVELKHKDAKRVEMELKPCKGSLRVLSQIGNVEIEIDGKHYKPPVLIEDLYAGQYEVKVRVIGKGWCLRKLEVLPDELTDFEIEEVKDLIPDDRPEPAKIDSFSPGDQFTHSRGTDHAFNYRPVGDGHPVVRTLKGHTHWVGSVAFSPNGKFLASGGWDETVKLWSVSDGSLVRTLKEHTYSVSSVAFSPDGELLASGSSDKTIKLWGVSDGRLVHTLEGHTDWVWSVAFSPDGEFLASGSSDKTIKLWRVSDGSLVRTLEGHTDSVRSVAFSPDGELLASGSDDNTIRLWPVR
jgi:hypothetical protein